MTSVPGVYRENRRLIVCCDGKRGGEGDAEHLNGRMYMKPNKTWVRSRNKPEGACSVGEGEGKNFFIQ